MAEKQPAPAVEPDREVLAALVAFIVRDDVARAESRDEHEGLARGFLMEHPHIARAFTVDARARAAADEWIEWHKNDDTFPSADLINSLHELTESVGRSVEEVP